MICVSIGNVPLKQAARIASTCDMVEFRLDLLPVVTVHDVNYLISAHKNAVATCRPGGTSDRETLLGQAIESGATYVDLEIDGDPDYLTRLVGRAARAGCRVILSYHNFNGTPPREELHQIRNEAWTKGADICKIATMCHTTMDAGRLLSLLGEDAHRSVIIGMGSTGTITRIAALPLGSPFTFAAPDLTEETAPGQLSMTAIRTILDMLDGKKRV